MMHMGEKGARATKAVTLTIESRLENVELVGMAVNKFSCSAGFNEVDAGMIELCVVEAVTNSIKHAYHGEAENEVEIFVELQDKRMAVICLDSGSALPPGVFESAGQEALEIDLERLEELATRGRGLAIIKEVMDTVSYERNDGKNCLRMEKELP